MGASVVAWRRTAVAAFAVASLSGLSLEQANAQDASEEMQRAKAALSAALRDRLAAEQKRAETPGPAGAPAPGSVQAQPAAAPPAAVRRQSRPSLRRGRDGPKRVRAALRRPSRVSRPRERPRARRGSRATGLRSRSQPPRKGQRCPGRRWQIPPAPGRPTFRRRPAPCRLNQLSLPPL